MSSLKERVRAALDASGKTQTDLANACGIKPPSVNDWLSGKTRSLKAAPAQRAAACLGVNLLWLTEGKGPMRAGDAAPPMRQIDAANAPQSGAAAVTYDKVRSAVSAVLDALGLKYEDLVPDQAAARRRVERALRHEHADDDPLEQIGVWMGRPGERYGPSRATYAEDKTRFQAEVSPEPERNQKEGVTTKQERRS